MRLVFLFLLLFSVKAWSQCKTYMLGTKGDTLNCIDNHDKKQGRWIMKFESLRGEPGYEEEGEFKDGKKEGTWRRYSAEGDLLAMENYKWGNKNGTCRYYNVAGLVREESWKSVDPENPYDTVEVPDPVDPYKVEMKVIKIEATAVKHGFWKYYNSGSGSIVKTENYFLDQIEDPNKKSATVDLQQSKDSATTVKKDASKIKPKEVLNFEKQNSGKKKIRVRDGRTGF